MLRPFVTVLLLSSCGSAPKPMPTATESLIQPDPLVAFVANLDLEPGATVVTHQLEIDGKAPLELVVEERCVPQKCHFEGERTAKNTNAEPALTRFRIFDVSNPRSPVAVHTTPILAAHLATLTSAELDGDLPRELVLRSASTVFSEEEYTLFHFQPLTLVAGEWRPTEDRCASEMPKREQLAVLFSDVDADGRTEWISTLNVQNFCHSSVGTGFQPIASQPNQLQEILRNVLNQPSPDPMELMTALLILQAFHASPESLDGVGDVLMADYERSVASGVPLSFVTVETFGDVAKTLHASCRDSPEFRTCFMGKLHELSIERPFNDFARQKLLLQSLQWPERPDFANWADARLEKARTANETKALTELALATLPAKDVTIWAENLATQGLQVLLDDGAPVSAPSTLPPLVDSAAQLALGSLDALFESKTLVWDVKGVFAPIYAKLANEPERLESFREHKSLRIGLVIGASDSVMLSDEDRNVVGEYRWMLNDEMKARIDAMLKKQPAE